METKILDSNCVHVCRPKLKAGYADDCFAIFNNDNSFLDFLKLSNSQNNNIKFTTESALQCISFLDVRIKVNNANGYGVNLHILVYV